jgi:hypothetical protein
VIIINNKNTEKKMLHKKIKRKPQEVMFDDEKLFGDLEKKKKPASKPPVAAIATPQPVYVPLPYFSNDQYDEVGAFMRELEFEPGAVIGFCFRRPCEMTATRCLNKLTRVASSYIHCEVCIYDKTYQQVRNLMITRNTKHVIFVNHPMTQDQARSWDFIWVQLTEEQQRNVRTALLRILSTDEDRRFSSCNIWCFPLFALPCYFQCCEYTSRTCSEMTMVFIRDVFEFDDLQSGCCGAPNFFSYTPDSVYRYISDKARSGQIIVRH